MTCCSSQFFFLKKISRLVTCIFSSWKNGFIGSLDPKIKFSTNIYPKHLENIIDNLINSFMTSKNHPKTRINPKQKNLTKIRYVFLGGFTVNKLLMWAPLIKRSNLTQISTFLVSVISVSGDFVFSLALDFNNFLSSLSY